MDAQKVTSRRAVEQGHPVVGTVTAVWWQIFAAAIERAQRAMSPDGLPDRTRRPSRH